MHDKLRLLTVIRLISCHLPDSPSPFKGSRCQSSSVVAAQVGVVQEVPHQPDLWDTEAVNDHELSVKTGVERLKVGRCRRPGNPEGAKSLMTKRADANQLEAHSQEDVIDWEKFHLREVLYKNLNS